MQQRRQRAVPPLTQNRDFLRVYKRGSSQVHPVAVTYILKNRRKFSRLGVTTSKKIGGAVQRNRARRLIMQSMRTLWPGIKPGYDIVVVARGKTPYVKCQQVEKALRGALQKAGAL